MVAQGRVLPEVLAAIPLAAQAAGVKARVLDSAFDKQKTPDFHVRSLVAFYAAESKLGAAAET